MRGLSSASTKNDNKHGQEHKHRQKVRHRLIKVPGTNRACATIRGHVEWVPLSAIDIDGLGPEWQ